MILAKSKNLVQEGYTSVYMMEYENMLPVLEPNQYFTAEARLRPYVN